MSNNELLKIEPMYLQFPCKLLFWLSFFMILHVFLVPYNQIFVELWFNIKFYNLLRWVDVVELKKQMSCSLNLTNKTDNNVAFKVNFFFESLNCCWLSCVSKASRGCFFFFSLNLRLRRQIRKIIALGLIMDLFFQSRLVKFLVCSLTFSLGIFFFFLQLPNWFLD